MKPEQNAASEASSGPDAAAVAATANEPSDAESTQTALPYKEEVSAYSGALKRKRHSHRHRRSHHGRQHWSERSKLLLGLLALVTVFSGLTLLFMGVKIYSLDQRVMELKRDNIALQTSLSKSREELALADQQTKKLQEHIESLLKGQLPGLTRIEYNQVIPLNKAYLINIIFNKVNTRNSKGYEFRILMKNNNLVTIWPKAKVTFFDRTGLQMNAIDIGVGKEPFMRVDTLNPEEERADSSPVIPLSENEDPPSYFMIKLLN